MEFIARVAERIKGGFFHQGASGIGNDAGRAEMVLVIIADAKRGIRNIQCSRRCGLDIERLPGRKSCRQVGHEREVASQSLVPLIRLGIVEPSRECWRKAWRPGLQPCAGNITTSRLNLVRRRVGVGADHSDCSVGSGFEPKNSPG